MSDPVTIADHASQQSDRWLFLALLVVVGLCAVGIWRWIVADRQSISSRLEVMTERQLKQAEFLATVVANNTVALGKVVNTIQLCREPRRQQQRIEHEHTD